MNNNGESKSRDSATKRKKIIGTTIGVVIFGGMSYVVFKQHCDIQALKKQNVKIESDIKILKEVVRGNVIHSMRESYKRKLRYAEGRLLNGITNDNVLSIKDIQLREEEIRFFSEQLENLDAAEKLISS